MRTSDPLSALWRATAPEAPATPPLRGARRVDLCVVGAGFTGLSTALHAAEAGASVAVLESHDPGFGASGRNHGQVVPVLSRYGPDEIVGRFGPEEGERFNRFIAESGKLVFDLIRRHGIECDAQANGWLLPVDSPAREGMVRARAEAWAKRDFPVRYMGRDETEAITGSGHWPGALRHDWGGNLQPLGYARGLARTAIGLGAAIYGESPAVAIDREQGLWRVRSPEGEVRADRVVLATNAYTDDLWPGLKRNIVPFRIFLAATVPQGDNVRGIVLPERNSVSDSRTILWAFRWDGEGRMVMGGDIVLPYGGRRRAVAAARRRLAIAFPQLADAEFEFVWDGKVAMTTDRLPRLFELAPGLLAGMGYNGRGIALATAVGRRLAAMSMGEGGEDPLPADLRRQRPVPLHRLAVPFARAALLHYRSKDAKAARSR